MSSDICLSNDRRAWAHWRHRRRRPGSTPSRRLPWRGDRVLGLGRGSAERERKSLDARIEELDLELSIGDGLRLPDQLIQPLFGERAVALVVDVVSVSGARRLSVDEDAK